jgi:hypothetical protein
MIDGSGSNSSDEVEGFVPDVLDSTIIALPLLAKLKQEPNPHNVVIDLNLEYPGGRNKARTRAKH